MKQNAFGEAMMRLRHLPVVIVILLVLHSILSRQEGVSQATAETRLWRTAPSAVGAAIGPVKAHTRVPRMEVRVLLRGRALRGRCRGSGLVLRCRWRGRSWSGLLLYVGRWNPGLAGIRLA